jgi:subtilisin family serine protease
MRRHKGIIWAIVVLAGLSFVVGPKYAWSAVLPEDEKAKEESGQLPEDKEVVHSLKDKLIGEKEVKPKLPEYAPGEVLVGLKQGSNIEEVVKEIEIKPNSYGRVHDIKPAVNKFKKTYKLEKDSEGYYWFLDKNYKEVEDIPDEDLFKEAYKSMPEVEKKLYRSYKIKLPEGVSVEEAAAKLKENSNVEYAEPNYIAKPLYIPNDPLYPQQWAHQKTQAEAGWNIERGKPNVVIAIVDTGVDYNHEDLAANIWRDAGGNPGKDFVDIDTAAYIADGFTLIPGEDYTQIDNDPSDYFGHGTHCAGIVGAVADNNKGVAGVCHNCKIMPVRAGFSIFISGYGEVGLLEEDDTANAIIYAADNGAQVISMSFGGYGSQVMKSAIDYAYSKGTTLVAAAGNSNSIVEQYPAAYENVIAVAATASDDSKAYYSSYGAWVDVAAPGGDKYKDNMILSTVPKIGTLKDPSGYRALQGTSMACPYVAGLAGLIRAHHPTFTNAEVRQVLRLTADDVGGSEWNLQTGHGRVNNYQALLMDKAPSVARITSISFDRAKGLLQVKGSAYGAQFVSYRIEYGHGQVPESWNLLYTSTNPVMEGTLCAAPAELSEEGYYTLRLTVETTAEKPSKDWALFYCSRFFMAKWGSVGIGESEFLYPMFIAVHPNGEVYVSDLMNGRIQVFDSAGTLLRAWSLQGWPGGIAVDQDGTLLVVDALYGRLSRYSSNGTWLEDIFTDNSILWDVGVDTDGIYLLTLYGKIYRLSPKGVIIDTWETSVETPGGIAVADGFIYLPDQLHQCVYKFTTNGKRILTFGSWGSDDGLFEYPGDVAVDRALGHVYVSDIGNGRVQVFNTEGIYLGQWGSPGTGEGQFTPLAGLVGINGLDVDGEGRVYALDTLGGTVQKFQRPIPLQIALIDYQIDDSQGDNNGYIDPGGEVKLLVTLKNVWMEASTLSVALETDDPYVTVVNGLWKEGTFPFGSVAKNIAQPFVLRASGDLPLGHQINFKLKIDATAPSATYHRSRDFQIGAWYRYARGWPQLEPKEGSNNSVVSTADLDRDGNLEVVYTTDEGVFVRSHDGTLFSQWPIFVLDPTPPAIADLDGDGDLEIVVGSFQYPTGGWNKQSQVFAWHHDGRSVEGWPKTVEGVLGMPVIADLDNDGSLEITMATRRWDETSRLWDLFVYVWDSHGTLLLGWPKFLPQEIINNYAMHSPVAVADVDGDKDREIIVSTDYNLYVWHHTGASIPELSQSFRKILSAGAPVVGDLEGDGQIEIILPTLELAEDEVSSVLAMVYVWSNGRLASGWPQQLSNGYVRDLALGDIDGDKDLEIVASVSNSKGGNLYAWHHDGKEVVGWPIQGGLSVPPLTFSPPTLGDLDGDGKMEVISKGTNYDENPNDSLFPTWKVFVWHDDATPFADVFSIPLNGVNNDYSFSELTDLDSNGDIEIALSNVILKQIGQNNYMRVQGIYVWGLEGQFNRDNIGWGTFRHDLGRTGDYSNRQNIAPRIAPIPPQVVSEAELLKFTISASDPDGDPLSWKFGKLPDVNADGFINWSDVMRVMEIALGQGSPPSPEERARADLNGDGRVDFVGDGLTAAKSIPMGAGNAEFEIATKTFQWTPAFGQARSYDVTFTVSDGNLTDSQTVTITVLPETNPPTTPGTPYLSKGTNPNNTGTYTITWTASTDAESGLKGYYVVRNNQKIAFVKENSYPETNLPEGIYIYQVFAEDNAGNASNLSGKSQPIVVDKTPPIIPGIPYISSGINPNKTGIYTITWTASSDTGGSGLKEYQVYRNGKKFPTQIPITTNSYSENNLPEGSYAYMIMAIDNAGNASSPSATSQPIVVDKTLPTGSILINNNAAYTNSTSVTLNLSATDAGGSGLDKMQFSNNGTTWSTAEAYATKKAWVLTTGNGTKTVYTKFSDKAGNWSGVYADTIILDTTKPSITGITTSPSVFDPEAGQSTSIKYTLADNLSSSLEVYVYVYTSTGSLVRTLGPYKQALGSNSITWDGKDSKGAYVANGIYKYRIKATDQAGNETYSGYYYVTKK